MIAPSGVTPHTAPSTCTEAGAVSRELTDALSHLARKDAGPGTTRMSVEPRPPYPGAPEVMPASSNSSAA
jgi:hypothetical protein